MSARHLIDDLHRRGLRIEPDGDRLAIEGPEDALTPELIERIRSHKLAILVALCSSEWTADDWRELYEERLAVAMIDGEQTEAEARRIAYECCVIRWLDLHPIASDGNACVACGKPDLPADCLLPFGVGPHAWLHSRCWSAWHVRRRSEAATALAAAGITPNVESAA